MYPGRIKEPTSGYYRRFALKSLATLATSQLVKRRKHWKADFLKGQWKHRGRSHPVTAQADDIKKWAGGSLAVASNKAKDEVKATAVTVGTIWLQGEKEDAID